MIKKNNKRLQLQDFLKKNQRTLLLAKLFKEYKI